MGNKDDCEKDYIRCKSKCFDVLVENLAVAGDDAQKIKEAKEKYQKCRKLCKKAKEICDETND
jgi:hypothetical protein